MPDDNTSPARRRRRLRLVLLLAPLWLPAALWGAERIQYRVETDNAFCVDCHLHLDIWSRYDADAAQPAEDLAAYHNRPHAGAVRCIDCHVGEGVLGRAEVVLHSWMNTARFIRGDYDEPDALEVPMSDAACVKCHADTALARIDPPEDGEFLYHALPEHVNVPNPCVSCHRTHDPGPRALQFMDPAWVRPECAACHEDMGEH